jgi:hypothetical protein
VVAVAVVAAVDVAAAAAAAMVGMGSAMVDLQGFVVVSDGVACQLGECPLNWELTLNCSNNSPTQAPFLSYFVLKNAAQHRVCFQTMVAMIPILAATIQPAHALQCTGDNSGDSWCN